MTEAGSCSVGKMLLQVLCSISLMGFVTQTFTVKFIAEC